MDYKGLVLEAQGLNIHYAGLTHEKLQQRILDKKNGTGVYEGALIDPDTNDNELVKIANDLDISTRSVTHDKLVSEISKKLNNGYKLGVRYNTSPRITDLTDSELVEYFKENLELQRKGIDKHKEVYYKLESIRGEMIARQIPFPQFG